MSPRSEQHRLNFLSVHLCRYQTSTYAAAETKGVAIEHMDSLFGRHWFLNGVRKPQLPAAHDDAAALPADTDEMEDPKREFEHVDKSLA